MMSLIVEIQLGGPALKAWVPGLAKIYHVIVMQGPGRKACPLVLRKIHIGSG